MSRRRVIASGQSQQRIDEDFRALSNLSGMYNAGERQFGIGPAS
jgi:hypothetical protein